MSEDRYRIRATANGRRDQWLAFGPRNAVVLVEDPSRAYIASAASIETILRRRGRVFGHCDLKAEPARDKPLMIRTYKREHVAGRTRKMYLASGRDGRARLTPYEFEAFKGVEAEVLAKANDFFTGEYFVEEVA